MTSRTRPVRPLRPLVALALLAALLVPGPLGTVASGDPSEGSTPVAVNDQRRISVGGLHSCAVLDTGEVQCWGANAMGQLGNGTTAASTLPRKVVGISTALAVSAGNSHTCAMVYGGTVRCWGNNGSGQLGNGTTSPPDDPVLAPVVVRHDHDGNPATALVDLGGVTSIAAGGFHTCGTRTGGTVVCWGHDGSGQLGGGGGTGTSLLPVTVVHDHDDDATTDPVALTGVTAVTAGEYHSCALLGAGGEVKCWGHNGFGQLGNANGGPGTDETVAVAVSGLPDDDPHAHDPHKAVAVAAGQGHTCAVLDDNTARCWGHNFYGQLGNNTTFSLPNEQGGTDSHTPVTVKHDADPDPSPLNVDIQALDDIVSITAGQFHSCAGLSDGSARCWGNNGRGQLGDDNPLDNPPKNKAIAVPVASLGNARAVTAGGFHTCALVTGDTMSCWGYNFFGQLGSYRSVRHTPVTVTALSGARLATAGDGHACALVEAAPPADKPACWGHNASGELGANLTPSPADSRVPVPVFGIADVGAAGVDDPAELSKLLSAGNDHTCALPTPVGTPQCWGRNADGELGDATNTSRKAPVAVSALTTVTQISAGGGTLGAELGHTCARAADTSVRCWGDNSRGQLGNGTLDSTETLSDSNEPVRVRFDDNDDHLHHDPPPITGPIDGVGAVEVASGAAHSCARLDAANNRRVRCWGANDAGQLGDGTHVDRHYAVTVDKNDEEPDSDDDPLNFEPLENVVAIAAGLRHSCAIAEDAGAPKVFCWGDNSLRQLGNGTTTSSDEPVEVNLSTVGSPSPLMISAGDNHTCARVKATSGSTGAVCWGDDSFGQLGNGPAGATTAVVPVGLDPPEGDASGTDLVKGVSASRKNTCAALLDTTVSCWGDNTHGQLGDGVGQHSRAPIAVENLGSVGGNAIPAPLDDTATIVVPPPPATSITINVLANDGDADGDALTVASVSDPARGTATTDGTTVTYTPDSNFCTADPTSNQDTFTYAASDGTATVPATVTVTVNCPNTAPDAVDDPASTNEDTAVSIEVTANDTDVNGDDVTVQPGSLSTPSDGGSVVVNPGGKSVTYTPAPDFFGTETFTYRATDGTAQSAPATVTVTVSNVNDPPVATDDAATTPEDTAVTIDVIANDSDIDSASLGVVSVSDPPHGTAQSVGPHNVEYTPSADFCGTDNFTYTVSDGSLTDTGSVTVNVTCVNDGPHANDDSATTAEDVAVTVDVLANDVDPEGDPLTITAASDPPHGTATVNGGASITYTPDPDFCGADSFSYTISDGGESDVGLVVPVTVVCHNDAPVANDDTVGVAEDASANVDVLANDTDVDGDTLVVASATDPAHGSTRVASSNRVVYTPDPDFCGTDTFTYTARDVGGFTDDATVTVSVACVNDAPSLASISDRASAWGNAASIPLASSDADAGDPDPVTSDEVTYSLTAAPAGASLVETSPGSFSVAWTPTREQIGRHLFTVRATDGNGLFDDESFTFTVTKRSTSLTYTGATVGQHSDPVEVSATLVDPAGAPVTGATLTFAIGTRSASNVTGPSGSAATTIVLGDPAGTSSVSVTFAGDAAYVASASADPFTIAKEHVVTTFAGRHLTTTSGTSAPVRLEATVAEEADGHLGSGIATLRMHFTEVGGALLCSAPVSMTVPGQGRASCTTDSLALGSRAVVIRATGASYGGPVDVASFAVAQVPSGSAAGAGRVSGDAVDDFAFQVRPVRRAAPAGDAVHVYRSGPSAMVVKTDALTSLSRNCTGGKAKVCTATIEGSAADRWSVDLATGAVAVLAGTPDLRIDATDAAEPDGAGSDSYAVAISAPDSYSRGSAAAPIWLAAGNVRIP